MKKILLFLILSISSITLVNATSDDIVYDWGNYWLDEKIDFGYNNIKDIAVINSEIYIAGNFIGGNRYLTFQKYDSTGNLIINKSIEKECDYGVYIFNDTVVCETYGTNYNKYIFYDFNLELQKEVEAITKKNIVFKDESDKYYIFGDNIIEKETYTAYSWQTLLEQHKKYSEYQTAITNQDKTKQEEIIKEIINSYFQNTIFKRVIEFDYAVSIETPENISYGDIVANEKYVSLVYSDSTNKSCGIDIYDENNEFILNEEIECTTSIPQVLLLDRSFIVVSETLLSSTSNEGDNHFDALQDLNYTEYDYKGNVIYRKKLTEMESEFLSSIFTDAGGRSVTKLMKTSDGFVLVLNYTPQPKGNITEGSNITGEAGAVLKYSYKYSITTKTDGNGTVTSTKIQAGSGEKIKYEITPKEGYVLGVVKITDANGNTITTTNSTFTMPSSDVTIEVTFVAENPDTASKTLFIFSSFLIIITSIVLMIKQIKEFKWIQN